MTLPSQPSGTRASTAVGYAASFLRGHMAWAMLLAIGVVLALLLPSFLTVNNLLNILRQSSFIGIVAIGMSFAMIAGAFDLSVGAVLGVAGVLLLTSAPVDLGSTLLGATLVFAVALVIGLANGVAVGLMRANSVVTTIGTAFVVLGLTLIYTGSQNITVVMVYGPLQFLSSGRIGRVPVPTILFLIMAVTGAALPFLDEFRPEALCGRRQQRGGRTLRYQRRPRPHHGLRRLRADGIRRGHAHRHPRAQPQSTVRIRVRV